jgi:beta-xylosidase
MFIVQDGPVELDGYTWWQLIAPYDERRAGWAAAAFLEYIPPPEQ